MELRLTTHAVERYRERVRPGLDLDAAADELGRLATLGEIRPEAPAWLAVKQLECAPCYLVIGDVVLPLQPISSGVLKAVTCLSRGVISTAARLRRNAHRRRRGGRRTPRGRDPRLVGAAFDGWVETA